MIKWIKSIGLFINKVVLMTLILIIICFFIFVAFVAFKVIGAKASLIAIAVFGLFALTIFILKDLFRSLDKTMDLEKKNKEDKKE